MNYLTRLHSRVNTFENMINDFDKMFSSLPSYSLTSGDSYPKANLWTDGNLVKLEIALPGLKKEDIEVNYLNGVVSVKAKSANQKESSNNGYVLRELHKSSFSRSFNVGKVDDTSISCSFDNGVLHFSANSLNLKETTPRNLLA